MKGATPVVVAALSLLAAPSAATLPAMAQAPRSLPADARPATGTAPTIAAGQAEVVAWLQESAGARRVVALAGAETAARRLGPVGPGADGAPVSAVTGDGSLWIMATRGGNGTQVLWAQRWSDGRWQVPIAGPRARPLDHHPALAAVPATNDLWAAWLGETGAGADDMAVYASRWTGAAWTAAEPLPGTVGAPMAPSLAIDTTGAPVIAWAAGDGDDAEIWWSRRRGGRWSSPQALTRNRVPDITPSLAATPWGMAAAWISYTDAGYLPVAAVTGRDGAWSGPRPLAATPGSRPRAAVVNGMPAVFWRRLEETTAAGTLQARVFDGEQWGETRALAPASGSPFHVAADAGGRLLLAYARPDGGLAVAAGEPAAADPLESLARSAAGADARRAAGASAGGPVAAPAADPPKSQVPHGYTAFGDSITNGVVYDPDRRDSVGYREPLQDLLRAFFGIGSVFNAGVDGESTSDGVGRIDNAIRAQQPGGILIMEGTNDILDAVDVETIAFNLRRMVQRSYEEDPDILPFLAQIPPRLAPGPDGFDGAGNGRIDELNELLPEIGEDEGAVVVDMNTPIDGHPELMSNHVHPSVAGYQVIAEQWYDAVQPVVLEQTNHGDVDASGRTDGFDLVRLALAFGAIAGEPRYNGGADVNGDGIVDGFDLDLLIEFFGRGLAPGEGEGGS